MYFQAIRGAITIDSDTPEEIYSKTKELLCCIVHKNNLVSDQIVSVIFTATHDIKSAYPAVAARQLGFTDIPLMCCQEMYVNESLNKCIRVLMHIQSADKIQVHHMYLRKAALLRPDLSSEECTT